MKYSTMVAVFAVVFAAAVSGCRYNKSGAGDDGLEGSDINTEAMDSSLTDAAAGEGNFEEIYAKCTDVEFAPVYFGFDSTVVPQGELAKIDAVAQHLKDNGKRVVVVAGHCDERGSNEYNLALGENRATIVRNYLVESGVEAERIQTRSYGEEQPAADGHEESVWAKNRRGEFGIFQK